MRFACLFPLVLFLVMLSSGVRAQATYDTTIVHRDGRVMTIRIRGNDTTVLVVNPEVVVKARPVFADDEEYRHYMRYRRYATRVLPYAIEGIRMYNNYLRETEGLKKGKARKYAKSIQKDAKDEFTDPLKNLSRTEGKILVKMIERHLNTPMYDVLRDVRGSWTATKWQTIGRMYGYDLKEGYHAGQDKIMDMILQDFEITVQ
jgi:hypothetical protein